MDKNFFIAIIISTLIILIYTSPFYQKRFGKEIPRETETFERIAPGSPKPAISEHPPSLVAETPQPESKSQETILTVQDSLRGLVQINAPASEKEVILENNDIKIIFSTRGGVIKNAFLKHFEGMEEGVPVHIVTDGETWYDGEVQDSGSVLSFSDLIFAPKTVTDTHAVLEAEIAGNKTIRKEFTLDPEGYLLNAKTHLSGRWEDPSIHFTWHGPLAQTEIPVRKLRIWPFTMFMRDENLIYMKLVYLGQGERTTVVNGKSGKPKPIYSKEDVQKLDMKKNGKGYDTFIGDLDWFAVRNKYFISAAMPAEKKRWSTQAYFSKNESEKWFDFAISKHLSDGNTDLNIYLGPMSFETLKSYGKDLTKSMELSFKFIRPLSIAFLWLFKKLRTVIPNWGLVIVIFAVLIKVVLYPFSKSSYDSMKKMQKLQPQISKLKDKYKNNPKMLQKATMELYKKEGVSPLGGCLPLVFQMPVFFALYPVVGRAFELRQAMFIPHWIEDLSRPDPFYFLPVAMGISMFFQMRTSSMQNPNQKAMLYVMPVMMVIMFANFSSGLTLYWFLFNILTYAQQKINS